MANISDVEGVMTLVGDWTPEMINDLNTTAKEWSKWYYNIDIFDEFSTESLSSRFCANGRGSFDSNLDWCGKALRESEDKSIVVVYDRLCEELKSRVDECGEPTAFIEAQFDEHESGCGILRSAEAIISVVNGELEGIVTNEEIHDYTKKNLVELGFYDSEDGIEWFDEEEKNSNDK